MTRDLAEQGVTLVQKVGQGNYVANVLKTTIRLDNVQSFVNLKLTNTHAHLREIKSV